MNATGKNMNLDTTTIEGRAVHHLKGQILRCPRLNCQVKTEDKEIAWDGYIQFFHDKSKKKSSWVGRCPIQVKGHAVDESDLRKRQIKHSVSVDDLRVYKQDGGALYFVIYVLDDESKISCKIFYNEFLPIDVGNILATIKESQKTISLPFMPFPGEPKEIEGIVAQFIRDKGLQGQASYEYPIRLKDSLSEQGTYTFWMPTDFSILGNKRPTYIYKNSKERKGIYYPVGKVCFEEATAKDVPLKVRVDGKIFFDHAHIVFKAKGKIKSIFFNRGLSLSNINTKTAKIRITQKCTFDEYIQNLKFLLEMSKGKTLSIDGLGDGTDFKFDTTAEQIADELAYMEKISQLLKKLHVTKEMDVGKFSQKNMTDLYYLYRGIIKKENFIATSEIESVIGKYNAGPLQFMIIRLVDDNKQITYQDGFDTVGMHCEMSDIQDKRHPASIYLRMKKEYFLSFDNIYYPEILRSIVEVEYSKFYGDGVNCLVLEMLDAYDESPNAELLDTTVKISCWLYEQESNTIYFLNKMQAIKRQREFRDEEQSLIRDIRSKETDNFLLAGFAAVLGNSDDYQYYLGKLEEEQRSSFLMYPIKNLMKDVN